ncbi:hypothetical protein BAUCODRAFT_333867 [Baudoinia panamericana UAMH 10762]|uniref:Uncharacterized protein n=1 Tax=Baudoinia panamericana (strain UAMH 10762) TaxID=717646 RepID=M2MX53_BAUPA|nr:uncharacterized protein BAUCODRAFT_333867 [Baudoinia panamericana UAMH 10762]EMC90830.1 hypothetical protein BAUCODRAFT_333867 [Baudoinia panamericana UAMH 10762]
MSLLSPHLRLTPLLSTTRRTFSTTPHPHASILFALNALSNSRETQHFNKLSNLHRIEHSPPLKLIKTSEIDPYPLPTPPPPTPRSQPRVSARSAAAIWDNRALRLGRAMIADHTRQVRHLQHALAQAKQREQKKDEVARKSQQVWQEEARKLRGEVRSAGVFILLSIGTATALAIWRFAPAPRPVDSAELSRKITERAQRSISLPSLSVSIPAVGGAASSEVVPAATATVVEPVPAIAAPTPTPPPPAVSTESKAGWWKGLFWRQE